MAPSSAYEVSTVQSRARRSFIAVLVALIIALGLQAAGFGTRGWMIMKYSEDWLSGFIGSSIGLKTIEIEFGLWSIQYCVDSLCVTKDIGDSDAISNGVLKTGMTEFQVETSIALACLLAAIVVLVVSRCMSCQRQSIQLATIALVILLIISGILALVASGKFGDDTRKAHDLFNLLTKGSPFLFPYSLILTGVGGILACVMGLVLLCVVRPWQNDSGPPPAYEMGGPQPAYQYPSQPPAAGYPSAPSYTTNVAYGDPYGRKH